MRASSLLTEEDIAKDIRCAVQLKAGMEGMEQKHMRYVLADMLTSMLL